MKSTIFLTTTLLLSSTLSISASDHITTQIQCNRPTYTQDGFNIPFKSMVIFGDSFSDVGNIYNVSNNTQPSPLISWDGRYSDGRVWVEYLTQFFDLQQQLTPSTSGGTNYGWGGATTNNNYIDAFSTYLDDNVPSVNEQITQYLDDQQHKQRLEADNYEEDDDQPLHVLFSGYNDYWWYVNRNYTTSDGQDLNFTNVFTTVANQVVHNLQTLYDESDARIFLVANVGNMSTWAEASLQPQEVLDAYNVLVEGHNDVLASLLTEFEQTHPDAIVYSFDVFNSFECLNEEKDYLGILNVTSPCHPNTETDCGDIYSYKFWDYYHPTTHAHHLWSTSALQRIYDKQQEMLGTKKENSSTRYSAEVREQTQYYSRTSLRGRQ